MCHPARHAGRHRSAAAGVSAIMSRDRHASIANKFRALTGARRTFAACLAGLDAAVRAPGCGVEDRNAVALRGVNDDYWSRWCEARRGIRAARLPAVIEQHADCPTDAVRGGGRASRREIRLTLEASLDRVVAADASAVATPAPRRSGACRRCGARARIISAMTEHFCTTCTGCGSPGHGRAARCLGHDDASSCARDPAAAATTMSCAAIAASVTGPKKKARRALVRGANGSGAPPSSY